MFNHEKATENGNQGMGGGSSLSRVDRVKGSGEGKVSSYSASPRALPCAGTWQVLKNTCWLNE